MSDGPLAGLTILVTRARHQAGQLSARLREQGAEVIEIPAIAIAPPDSYAPLDTALRNLSHYQWLIVTSANGAEALSGRREKLGVDHTAFAHLKVAAVGPATQRALEKAGVTATVKPQEYVAESLVDALGEAVSGQRILLVRAAVARDVIPDSLRGRGATVDVAEAYRTVIPESSIRALRELLGAGRRAPDAATFTSSSTVTNFLALAREASVAIPRSMRAVSIGPVTSQTLREAGLDPAAEADPHDLEGLVQAVIRSAARSRSHR